MIYKSNLIIETGFINMKGGHMKQKSDFEALLEKHRIAVERYINFRLINRFDADDVIGETYYAAYVGYETLRDKALFKQWILSIAKNQCNLWLRKNMAAILYRSTPFLTYPIPKRQRIMGF